MILALGRVAHRSVLRAQDLRQTDFAFGHLLEHPLPGGMILLDSYHCSRYNFNTGRLTRPMFDRVFERLSGLLQ